jgi:isopentenyldiphosphate isomerase
MKSMADEMIDIYDEDNNPTGEQKKKSEAHRDGLWHRAAHIWIHNSKGEILLQLRSKDKVIYPDVWDVVVAGHVGAGEDVVDCGIREAQEEVGLKIEKKDLDFGMIWKYESKFKELENNEFFYVYFVKFDGDIEQLKLQEEEVQKIKFFSVGDLEEELKNIPEKFAPHGDYWVQVLNEIKKRFDF